LAAKSKPLGFVVSPFFSSPPVELEEQSTELAAVLTDTTTTDTQLHITNR